MNDSAKSIRPFIGSKDFKLSSSFYRDLGFEEILLFPKMSLFKTDKIAFYLQDYYAKEWVDNTMVFIEVDDVDTYWQKLLTLDLPAKYAGVRLGPIQRNDWGSECFVHDPAGVLWHFGQFSSR